MARRVILLMRAPRMGGYSIERVFEEVGGSLPGDIDATIVRVPFESRGILRRLGNLLFTARLRADVIHVTGDVHYCVLGVRRTRCVLTVHDLSSFHRLRGLRRSVYFLLWFRLPTWWAARVTTVSRSTMDELVHNLPSRAGKIVVVANPVGACFLQAERRAPVEHPIAQVLVVGTGSNKNLAQVVEALEALPVHVRIIGALNAAHRDLLEKRGLSYSAVACLSSEQMVREYAESDLLAFVSTYEGFGLPIVEAQAVGLPVVTSNTGAMPEVAADGALLVDPSDSSAIRDAVALILSSAELRRSLVTYGRRNVDSFRPEVVAARYAEIYRSLGSGT